MTNLYPPPVMFKNMLITLLLQLVMFPCFSATISGARSVHCNATSVYSFIGTSSFCSNVIWTISRPDGTTSSGTGSSIAVNWGNATGQGSVSASGLCPNFESAAIIVSVVGRKLETPTLSGPSHLCNGETATYTASTVTNVTSYTFTVPSGWSINGTSTTSLTTTSSSVDITAISQATSSATIEVRADYNLNDCFTSSDFRKRTIRYGIQSIIVEGPSPVIPNSLEQYIFDATGITNISWTTPPNWLLFGPTNTSDLTVGVGRTSGNVTARGFSCGSNVDGSLYVTVSVNGGIDEIVRTRSTGEAEHDNRWPSSLNVYPNPVTSMMTIQLPQTVESQYIQLVDPSGQQVLSTTLTAANTQLDLSTLAPGLYYLLYEEDQEISVKKIMVTH